MCARAISCIKNLEILGFFGFLAPHTPKKAISRAATARSIM